MSGLQQVEPEIFEFALKEVLQPDNKPLMNTEIDLKLD